MIDEDIILEMSDLLTALTYCIRQPDSDEYYELFILLKNLYDSIGYYTYSNLEPKEVWNFFSLLTLKLKEFTFTDDYNLEYRIKNLLVELQQYFENVHGKKNISVIPEWSKGFEEFDQLERDIKSLTWRFGSCLAICLRAGVSKNHQLIQFLLDFLDLLNKGLYGSQGIPIIEVKLLQSEREFNRISRMFGKVSINGGVGTVGYHLDLIEKDYKFTINELKKMFKL